MIELNEDYFAGLLEEMLTEAVQSNRVINSMKNRVVNKIFYDGEDTVKTGYRSIEVYCFGVNRHGNAVIRAWQREGVSDTPFGNGSDKLTEKPGWRMFRLDGIKSFNNTNQTFNTDSNFLQKERPRYNAHDKDMQQIYYAIEPTGANTIGTNVDTSNAPDADTRTDKPSTEPMFSGKKPLFKSSEDKPLFGSKRDEKEKENSINPNNSRTTSNVEKMFK